MKTFFAAVAVALSAFCCTAFAADLKVFSTTALTEPWPELMTVAGVKSAVFWMAQRG